MLHGRGLREKIEQQRFRVPGSPPSHFRLEHGADARPPVGKRDVPVPRLAVDWQQDVAGASLGMLSRSLKVREERDAAHLRVRHSKLERTRENRCSSRGVDHHPGEDFFSFAAPVDCFHAHGPVALEEHPFDLDAVLDLRAASSGMVEHERIEFRPGHLVGGGMALVPAVLEVHCSCAAEFLRQKCRSPLDLKFRRADLVSNPEPVQKRQVIRKERFADPEPGKIEFFQNENINAGASEKSSGSAAARPATDDDHLPLFQLRLRRASNPCPAAFYNGCLFESSAVAARARNKWVSHGLSNAIVYGGLHYGARWLPLFVLHGISLFGNSLAVALMKKTIAGIENNFRLALGASPAEARRLARRVFFEYGNATIDVWRLRSDAFTPEITTFEEDGALLAGLRAGGKGFLLVTGHVGNWEMGAVTLRRHGLNPTVVGQPELDPHVHAMRQQLRERLGVESIDIGSSMATAFQVRAAIERGRAVALLVDRAYPEDQVIVPYLGRPTPFLRSPALLARFCDCEIISGFFLRNRDGSYRNVWGKAVRGDRSLPPDQDAHRVMSQIAEELGDVVRAYPTQWYNFYRFWSSSAGGDAGLSHLP
jgi:Kdo2-lipid IVA lauroyltransferase/acyltransferase